MPILGIPEKSRISKIPQKVRGSRKNPGNISKILGIWIKNINWIPEKSYTETKTDINNMIYCVLYNIIHISSFLLTLQTRIKFFYSGFDHYPSYPYTWLRIGLQWSVISWLRARFYLGECFAQTSSLGGRLFKISLETPLTAPWMRKFYGYRFYDVYHFTPICMRRRVYNNSVRQERD